MQKRTIIFISALAILVFAAVTVALLQSLNIGEDKKMNEANTQGTNLSVIASNLDSPWSVVFYDDTPLVSSRNTGEIREILNDGTNRVVGVVEDSVHQGEGGLLGLAIDDQLRLYAYYTTSSDNRISRFTITGAPGSLALTPAETIIEGLPSSTNHNGGRIAFGPDAMLYVTVGDASDAAAAQDLARLNGKILRITADGNVPSDNPLVNSPIYSYGHRNPQGIAWSEDGTMYASEFGQNTWDELNIITAGANYGWPDVEGIEERDGFVAPIQQWATAQASPSGLAYANGTLYLANLRGAVLRTIPTTTPSISQELYNGEFGRIRDVVIAPNGEVWFITNNTDGRGLPGANDDRIISIPKNN